MIRHFLNPPNWFTSASLFCSSYAMMLLLQTGPNPPSSVLIRACVLVVFGGIFDMLDGRVARLTRRFTEFGVQLDSLADMLGFGLAPAMIAWTWKLHTLGPIGVAACFWYVLAAAFRLARFNVTSGRSTWPYAGHSQGLTSTLSGGILVTTIWMSNGYLVNILKMPAGVVAGLVVVLGLLMVSSIPFRNFKDVKANPNARRWLGFALASCLTGAVAFDASMWWGVGAALYLVCGLADGIVVLAQHRRLALIAGDDEEDEIE